MKALKILPLLLAGLTATSIAQAQNVLVQSKTTMSTGIHRLVVVNSGSRNVWGATVTLHAGVLQGSNCVYSRTVPLGSYSFGHNTTSYFDLLGEGLARNIGVGYSCIQLLLQTDKQQSADNFTIYNDGYVYTGTNPDHDVVTIN